jgi:hypothetical protein
MSEYQYYEWQTLDRPLTAAEQKAANELSSHINVTSTQAIVTYNWGSFKFILAAFIGQVYRLGKDAQISYDKEEKTLKVNS